MATPGPTPSQATAQTPSPIPSPTAEPTTPLAPVAVVPVSSFRDRWTETTAVDVASVLAGGSKRYGAVEDVAADR